MTTCYVCKSSKPKSEFHKNNKMCKPCKKDYMKSRYNDNKDEILKRKEKSRAKNKSGVKNYAKKYYRKNKSLLNKNSSNMRLNPLTYFSRLVIECRERAKKKNLPFDLDYDFLFELFEKQNKCCAVIGLDFSFEKVSNFRIRPWAPSVDRVDSKLGYTKDNVRLVCIAVNLAINQFGDDIFNKMCKSYISFHESKAWL